MHSNKLLKYIFAIVFFSTAFAELSSAAPVRLPKRYQDWFSGPVSYLITKHERQTFQAFQTDEERERFIERFWETRNPAPGSGQNEFKDEFYRRVDWANAHYGRYNATEGWRSEMGRTYILFGKPQTTMNYTANQELHPIELWFYSNPGLSELPPFFYVIFFERDDISGYRLYNPLTDGPDKLFREAPTKAQAYQYLRNLSAELAHASLTLIPGEPIDTDTFGGSMASVMILNGINGYRDMPSYVSTILTRAARLERITSHIDYDVARTALTTLVTREAGEPWLDWQIEVEDPLQAKAKDGRVQYDISARLYSHGRLVFERTDSPKFDAPAGSEDALKRRALLYEDRMPAAPGDYRLTVAATNRATGKVYEATREVAIPVNAERAVLSDIVVVGKSEEDRRPRPFGFAGVKFVPAVGGRVRSATGLHILYSVKIAEPHPPAYDVEYVLGGVATKIRKTFEDKLDLSRTDGGSVLTAKTLSLEELSPGTYQLAVRIKDPETGKLTAGSVGFTVAGMQDDPPPIVISRGGTDTPQWAAINQFERALCWLAQDRPAEAVTSLEASFKISQNPVTRQLLQHLYASAGQKAKTVN